VPELTRALGALLLVVVANVAPWMTARCLGYWRAPLDGGVTLPDGTRLLGDHKTWRGLILGTLACGATAWLLQYPLLLGIAFGLLSLAADSASSFVKRRLRLRPGAEIPGLDQLPEALVPLVVLSGPLGLPLTDSVVIAVVFMLLDIAAVRVRNPAQQNR
jgi:CDP-2,3-bis-(O-geranylgeranyl)-sn-glycerol synthase